MDTDKDLKGLGFNVISDLGEGVFSKVKLATSERHCNNVAIKIMDRTLASPAFVRKFLPRELDIIRLIYHPHIVEVHDVFEIPSGRVFIVMEAAATDLKKKIQELHRVPITQAKTWFSQLVSAVAYLHQLNIVHRDLKCENVLLTADGQVKLTDFGLVRFSTTDLSRTFWCTPRYAAPEVLLKKPYDPKKADVWSLGVILYVMVTGTLPFRDVSRKNIPFLQREALTYPDGIRVEQPCRSFISYMLQYKPERRPTVAEVAAHPWLQLTQEPSPEENVFGARCKKDIQQQQQQQQHQTAEVDVKETKDDSSTVSCLHSSVTDAFTQDTTNCLEKPIRLTGRFTVVPVDEDEGSRSHPDSEPLQEDDGSRAGASLTCRSVEGVEEEYGCFSCAPFCAALKRAANAFVVAPIF
ncbi:testis-specific serine/threonine-protein kinase 6-like [Salminus brasiliensis]|uniref:testis-specific serine/threonine-protein kinase 6-like n=1 Tax=Salminus brasiliensis TaxID=930266 RepID=UPI003B82FBC6